MSLPYIRLIFYIEMDETTQFTSLQMLWWETILPQQQNNNMSQCNVPILQIFCIEMDKTPLYLRHVSWAKAYCYCCRINHILSSCDEWNSDVVCEEEEVGEKFIRKPFISYLFCKKRVSLMTVIVILKCCNMNVEVGWLLAEHGSVL
jgi:hypothetical protein